MIKRIALSLFALVIGGAAVAGIWNVDFPKVGSGSYCASTQNAASQNVCVNTVPAGPVVLTGNETVPADTNLGGGQFPQTVIVPTALLMPSYQNARNMLDNGAMAVQQRGTGIITCAQNAAVTNAAYSADRWGCSANVAVGAGRTQVITATPAPPTGFQASLKVYRTSGALTQPVCAIQEIPTVTSTEAAGQTVTLSFYAQALAGLNADTANLINAQIIYGTGTDEGLGTMTASPAITPAWTGITTLGATNFTLSASAWTRYSLTVTLPATETELGVEICFTPTATGAGTTDGFAFTGAQLEVAPSPTQFEFRSYAQELVTALRYYYNITESKTVVSLRALCAVSSSSLAVCNIVFPQVMRVAPTMTYTSGFTLTVAAQTSAVVCTVNRTSTTLTGAAANTQGVPVDCTSSAGFGGAGTAAQLYDLGTSSSTGVITASADF